ncbi:MAG: tetratricopeptide repeat protein [Bacteroidota bacterium]
MSTPLTYSIAVLPFVNATPEPEHDYFCDGMAETIMTALAGTQGIRVTARQSSFAFKDQNRDIREVGQQLGVDYVLEGSVRRAGNRVRVTAQLNQSATGFQLWANVFDRDWEDVFALQDDISRHIVEQLTQELHGIPEVAPYTSTRNLDAYHHYLKGNFFFNKYTRDDIQQAITHYQRAVDLDPGFAQAYSGLANCYFYLGNWALMPAEKAYAQSKRCALKALELDTGLVEAHVRLALIFMYDELDWKRAARSFRQALDLNRDFAVVYQHYAWYLAGLRRFDEAFSALQKAQEYDPLSLIISNSIGDILRYAGRYEEAITQYKKTLELDPQFRLSMEAVGISYFLMGQKEEGLRWIKRYKKLVRHPLGGFGSLGYAYGMMGEQEKVQEAIRMVEKRKAAEPQFSTAMDLIVIYLGLKEYDRCLDYLEMCFEERTGIIFLLVDPLLAPLRKLPRYQKMISRILPGEDARLLVGPHISRLARERITIQTDLKESLEIPLQAFLYAQAQENYCEVYWQENQVVKRKLIRLPIKKLAAQIDRPHICRCHRSFLINLNLPLEISGNARGYKLRSRFYDFEVPVSRSQAENILRRLD